MSPFIQLDGLRLSVRVFGNDFVLFVTPDGQPDSRLPRLGKAILAREFDFVEEVIATPTEICLKVHAALDAAATRQIESLAIDLPNTTKTYRVPFRFSDQGDWSRIAEVTGMDRQSYGQQLIATAYHVAMFGFLPGFIYLDGLPEKMQCPRKENPSKSVLPGALAVGGPYLGVYPRVSPAGWNVVGQVAVSFLDARGLPPLLVAAGDRVEFELVTEDVFGDLMDRGTSVRAYNGIT